MRIPEFLKKMLGDVDALGIYNFIKTFRGGNDVPKAEARERGGLNSLADEQRYMEFLEEIREEDNMATHGQGDRVVEALDGFYRFLFPRGGPLEKANEMLYGNRYRKYLTTFPEEKKISPSTGEERKVESSKEKGKKVMRWMASVILSEDDREKGYKKILKALEERNVPTGLGNWSTEMISSMRNINWGDFDIIEQDVRDMGRKLARRVISTLIVLIIIASGLLALAIYNMGGAL